MSILFLLFLIRSSVTPPLTCVPAPLTLYSVHQFHPVYSGQGGGGEALNETPCFLRGRVGGSDDGTSHGKLPHKYWLAVSLLCAHPFDAYSGLALSPMKGK